MYEGRLLRKVASQAVECGKGSWMRSIGRCVDKFGLHDVSGGVIRESAADMKGMLLNVAWRNVRDEWRKEMHEKPMLSMTKQITECEGKSSCAFLKSKAEKGDDVEVETWNGRISD